jgi:Ca2+-binding EF-hand superfamily protein
MHPFKTGALSAIAASFLIGLPLAAQAQMQPAAPDAAAKDKSAIEAAFRRADVNKDGKLTRAEAEMLPSVAARFDDIDKDKKGYLTLDEFMAAVSAPAS